MDGYWFYLVKNRECGPVEAAHLQQLAAAGTIRADTLVRKDAHGSWVRASKVRGLLHGSPAPAPAKNAGAKSAEEVGRPTDAAKDSRRNKSAPQQAPAKVPAAPKPALVISRPFVDPILDFNLNPKRLGTAKYRQKERKRILREVALDDHYESGGRHISRNEVIEAFELLDDPQVCEYLTSLHASAWLMELWNHGRADPSVSEQGRAEWRKLVEHSAHTRLRGLWQRQWRSALGVAFRARVEPAAFAFLVACCEDDIGREPVCYEEIEKAATMLQERANEARKGLEDGRIQPTDAQFDELWKRTAAHGLLSLLPSLCDSVKTRCAYSLYLLGVSLHKSEKNRQGAIAALTLARDISKGCAEGKTYEDELHDLIQADIFDDFGRHLTEAIKVMEHEPWEHRATVLLDQICRDAPAAVDAANALTDDVGPTVRNGMTDMLATAAVLAWKSIGSQRFSLPLLEAAKRVQCDPELARRVEVVWQQLSVEWALRRARRERWQRWARTLGSLCTSLLGEEGPLIVGTLAGIVALLMLLIWIIELTH